MLRTGDMMADYFSTGWNDAARGTFYANGLPPGTLPNSETRATYRAGWICERARRGLENLPACFAELRGRAYWIVSVDRDGRPVYNVTNGEQPRNDAGYRDLAALMTMKGDRFA